MLNRLHRLERPFLIICGLGLASIIGWSGFGYSAWSAARLSRQVSVLTTARDDARAKHEQLQTAAGDLKAD
jgi:hypothetical protein